MALVAELAAAMDWFTFLFFSISLLLIFEPASIPYLLVANVGDVSPQLNKLPTFFIIFNPPNIACLTLKEALSIDCIGFRRGPIKPSIKPVIFPTNPPINCWMAHVAALITFLTIPEIMSLMVESKAFPTLDVKQSIPLNKLFAGLIKLFCLAVIILTAKAGLLGYWANIRVACAAMPPFIKPTIESANPLPICPTNWLDVAPILPTMSLISDDIFNPAAPTFVTLSKKLPMSASTCSKNPFPEGSARIIVWPVVSEADPTISFPFFL